MTEIARKADAGSKHGTMLPVPAGHPIGGVFDESGETHHSVSSVKVDNF